MFTFERGYDLSLYTGYGKYLGYLIRKFHAFCVPASTRDSVFVVTCISSDLG